MIDEAGLKRMFAGIGTVSSALVIRDTEAGLSKGFGFVSFPTREEAERAIQRMVGGYGLSMGRSGCEDVCAFRTASTTWGSS